MKKQINKSKLIQMYRSGAAVADICSACGVCKQTLYNILKSERIDLHRQKLHDDCGCPLFQKDIYNNIYCEDFGEWESLSLSFRDKQAKNAHKKTYCSCSNYINCSVYKIMDEG